MNPPPTNPPQVRKVFTQIRDHSFVDIDASGSVDEVHQRVMAEAAEAVRRAGEGEPVLALWDHAPLSSLQ